MRQAKPIREIEWSRSGSVVNSVYRGRESGVSGGAMRAEFAILTHSHVVSVGQEQCIWNATSHQGRHDSFDTRERDLALQSWRISLDAPSGGFAVSHSHRSWHPEYCS